MSLFYFFNDQFSVSGQILFISVFALIFGSFASLISYRLASQEPMVFTRSKCTNCNLILKFYNLIPLFSWIFQRGKCSKCHTKISIRYPLIELIFLITFLATFFLLGKKLDLEMILYLLIASTLIVMCITDMEHYFIPNSTQYFLVIVTVLLLISQGGNDLVFTNIKAAFLYTIFGLALLAFFYLTTKIEAIGVDDIKFFFIAGLMLGTDNFLAFMMLSGFAGVIFGSLWQVLKKEETFPFAPAICFSSFICLIFGQAINPVELMGKFIF